MRVLSIASIVIVSSVLLTPVGAQQPGGQAQHDHGTPAAPQGGMMDHEKMMAGMKAADARLEQLVQRMKSATGSDKTQAMQDLLSELVQNQRTMHQQMAMMHDQMMSQ